MKSETVELDGSYERALAKMNLKVEHGIDGNTVLTAPIQVIRDAITVPLPKLMLATLS